MKEIIIANEPVTATQSYQRIAGTAPRYETISARINKWFLGPLRQMNGDQGFLVLLILFPLYEKHLRSSHKFTGKFRQGHSIFNVISRDLNLSNDDSFLFWSHCRNGLLHRIQPMNSTSFEYVIRDNGPPVQKRFGCFWINPFALREHLIPIIESGLEQWTDTEFPIAVTFDSISPHS